MTNGCDPETDRLLMSNTFSFTPLSEPPGLLNMAKRLSPSAGKAQLDEEESKSLCSVLKMYFFAASMMTLRAEDAFLAGEKTANVVRFL